MRILSYDDLQSSNDLTHYGVLGMKWGIRKARKSGTTYNYKSRQTKKLERKYYKYSDDAEKYKRKYGIKDAAYISSKSKANVIKPKITKSKAYDAKFQKVVSKMNTGKVIAASILGGPWGNYAVKNYAHALAKGNSKTVARATAGMSVVSSLLATAYGATVLRVGAATLLGGASFSPSAALRRTDSEAYNALIAYNTTMRRLNAITSLGA